MEGQASALAIVKYRRTGDCGDVDCECEPYQGDQESFDQYIEEEKDLNKAILRTILVGAVIVIIIILI